MVSNLSFFVRPNMYAKRDRIKFTLERDNVTRKEFQEIQATHAPDGREVDVKPIFHRVEDIIKVATIEQVGKTVQDSPISMPDSPEFMIISRISNEMESKCKSYVDENADLHATTVSLFNMLSSYSWDAKLVLTLAAVAPKYVNYRRRVAPKNVNYRRREFLMLDVCGCIVEFEELPYMSITEDVLAFSVYCSIKTLVACAISNELSNASIPDMFKKFDDTQHNLAWRLQIIQDYLTKQLPICDQHNMATKKSPGSMPQQLIKRDRIKFIMADDNVMKQIQETHAPKSKEVDVKPILHFVEDTLNRATLYVDSIVRPATQAQIKNMEDKTHQDSFIAMLDSLPYEIDDISDMIEFKCLDAHATTVSLFKMLSSYSWDAKLVFALAAFAVNYGTFGFLAQINSSKPLSKSMAILKNFPPVITEHSSTQNPRFDALNNLIRPMLDVTKCIAEFMELPSIYITEGVQAFSTTATDQIPTAVYWTIRSIVACAIQITTLTSIGFEYGITTAEAWELSNLAHKLNHINDHLKKQLATCKQQIEEKRNIGAFRILLTLFEMIHIDNMKILKALIYAKDDPQQLFDGSTKELKKKKKEKKMERRRRETLEEEEEEEEERIPQPSPSLVNIDVLRRKNVLLLISSLDISQDELSILKQIYNESLLHTTKLKRQYEVVWIPIMGRSVQWIEPMQEKFGSLQSTMPWYTVHQPSLIDREVIRFIKEVWHFRNKPILVVLDPQGRMACPNAIHMMWIWGNKAFPFTSLQEEALWKKETWRLDLLVNDIDPTILNWIREGKYIFLYGGDDIEWIRKFTSTARDVAQAACIPLEMVYVEKSSNREQVRRVIESITAEKLSYYWEDLTKIWFFWTRLESMLFSKIQQGSTDDDEDPMTQEIKKLLNYNKDGGWAVLSKGSGVVINGRGTQVLLALSEYNLWKEHVPVMGFDVSIKDYHDKLHDATHPCCRFEFPSTVERIPGNVKCPECLSLMEKSITLLCCHD